MRQEVTIDRLKKYYPEVEQEEVKNQLDKYVRFFHEGTYVNDHQLLLYLLKTTDNLVLKLDV